VYFQQIYMTDLVNSNEYDGLILTQHISLTFKNVYFLILTTFFARVVTLSIQDV